MNPKTVNDLDPKLKETYERVMGTSLTPLNTASAPAGPTQATISQEPVTAPTAPIKPAPEMVASPQATKPTTSTAGIVIPQASTFKSTAITKKKQSLKPLLIITGGVIFFIAYGVVWAKIFGLF